MGIIDRVRGLFYQSPSLDVILQPGERALRKMSRRQLAEYKAGWAVGTTHWILADAEQRRREGWSGPVILSLVMSAIALVISIVALTSTD